LWKSDGTLITTLTGHRYFVNDVAFSPNGRTIAFASNDNTVRLWKSDGTLITTLTGHSDGVNAVAYRPEYFVNDVEYSPDGSTIASASWGTVNLWKSDGTLIATLKGRSQVNAVAFSPDGTTITSASDDKTVRLWRPTHTNP